MRFDRKGIPEHLEWSKTEYKLNKSQTMWLKDKKTKIKKPVDFMDAYQSSDLSVIRWQC